MPYEHDYVCMMKEPVVCELRNKSYVIGRYGLMDGYLYIIDCLPGGRIRSQGNKCAVGAIKGN